MSGTSLPKDLSDAYENTDYIVSAEAGFVLKVNAYSEALASEYARHGVSCSAFITAFNPLGKFFGETDNKLRQAKLQQCLVRQGLVFYEGRGEDPSKKWPAEDSFLAFGLSLEDAKVLGMQFEQNAVVWAGADAVPRLIYLR